MPDIFISYARSQDHLDHSIARAIRDRLVSMGLIVFMDIEILPGEAFEKVIQKAVGDSKIVVGLWSAYALGRDAVVNECRLAAEQNKLVPILIDDAATAAIPVFFRHLNYQKFDDESEASWKDLISSLSKILRVSDLPQRFELSIKPLLAESTTAESTNIATILGDLDRGRISIPDYQRDSEEWDHETQSTFIESIINNLAIPALFFEPTFKEGREMNEVVDGQQRLTTLQVFRSNKLRLLPHNQASYISPNSLYYAGRTYSELPQSFRDAFDSYRLSIIKLRNLGNMRLEVFRRINRGGVPLSAQDIRLAYYGENSRSVTFIRIAGIYDKERGAASRFLKSAQTKYALNNPWEAAKGRDLWYGWWTDKASAQGQSASAMFLWALVAAQYSQLNKVIANPNQLAEINVQHVHTDEDALNAYCARSQFEERPGVVPLLFTSDRLEKSFFPFFADFFHRIQGSAHRVPLNKARTLAIGIGAAYRIGVNLSNLPEGHWKQVMKFINSPKDVAPHYGVVWNQNKGQWLGKNSAYGQMKSTAIILRKALGHPPAEEP